MAMKIYTVHLRRNGLDPGRDFVLIPERFNLPAFVLGPVWMVYHRLWLAGFAVLAIHVVLQGLVFLTGFSQSVFLIVSLAIAVILGLCGNDMRRARLKSAGFAEQGVVSGDTYEEAARRYLDSRPGLAAAMVGNIRSGDHT